MIANLSLPAILKKSDQRIGVSNIALPVLVTGILAYVFYGTFISISLPVIAASASFGAWVVFSIIYSYLKRGSAKITLPEMNEERVEVLED